MAPLTRSIYYKLPELPLEAPCAVTKNIQASSYPIPLSNPNIPRLVTFKKSGTCSSCGMTSLQSCADCCGMVFYCNSVCQTAHWCKHKEMCQDLKNLKIEEVTEAKEKKALNLVTEDIGNMISSGFKCLNYKTDPKLSVRIDEFASFGDLYDVSESSSYTMRSFHPGTYTCTSVTPDESCVPITIYHHESVDPVKVMRQCVLMSKDIFEHNDIPNQITMPQWCKWECADEEYIQSDSEYETSDSEVSENEVFFADFVKRVIDDKLFKESDSEDQEYDPSESDSDDSVSSDESGVSDHEIYYLAAENRLYIRDIPYKRLSIPLAAEMEVTDEDEDEDDGSDSDVEFYNDFISKMLAFEHRFASDSDDSDYLPYSESDSDSGESVPERDISDSELYISDSEVEVMLETIKEIRDKSDEMYDEFMEKVLDRYHIEESDTDDENYIPVVIDSTSSEEYEISDSEAEALYHESKNLIKNLPEKRQSYQTEFSSSESDSDSEVSSEEELYEDFIIHTEAKYDLSDTEDIEYVLEESESESSSSDSSPSSEDEMEISEFDDLVDDSIDDVKQVSGHKRKSGPSQNETRQETEAEMQSDEELYHDFKSKVVIGDAFTCYLDGSEDEEFVPPAVSKDFQDCSQDESQDEFQDESQNETDSQDEGSQASDMSLMDVSDAEISDLELSSEDKLYEEFKDDVCQTQRKVQAQKKPKSKIPSDNKELMFFMNSNYTSSLKNSWKIENGSEISGSFILKNGPESSGIAVEMKGQNWRSAHVFEDNTSGKAFALVVSTDTWEHLSNNYEHLEAHYPNQKWSSVTESDLKFQMKDFLC